MATPPVCRLAGLALLAGTFALGCVSGDDGMQPSGTPEPGGSGGAGGSGSGMLPPAPVGGSGPGATGGNSGRLDAGAPRQDAAPMPDPDVDDPRDAAPAVDVRTPTSDGRTGTSMDARAPSLDTRPIDARVPSVDTAPPRDTAPTPPAAGAGTCSVTREGATGNEAGGMIPVCCAPTADEKAMIDEVFRLVNEHRAANGVGALTYDPKLEAAIHGHAVHMATHAFFSHTAPEASVSRFTARAQACGASAGGENIARGQRSAAAVMQSWKNSAGHNQNMLNARWRRMGVGVRNFNWGQIFGQ